MNMGRGAVVTLARGKDAYLALAEGSHIERHWLGRERTPSQQLYALQNVLTGTKAMQPTLIGIDVDDHPWRMLSMYMMRLGVYTVTNPGNRTLTEHHMQAERLAWKRPGWCIDLSMPYVGPWDAECIIVGETAKLRAAWSEFHLPFFSMDADSELLYSALPDGFGVLSLETRPVLPSYLFKTKIITLGAAARRSLVPYLGKSMMKSVLDVPHPYYINAFGHANSTAYSYSLSQTSHLSMRLGL